jgi:hypothetical protein
MSLSSRPLKRDLSAPEVIAARKWVADYCNAADPQVRELGLSMQRLLDVLDGQCAKQDATGSP